MNDGIPPNQKYMKEYTCYNFFLKEQSNIKQPIFQVQFTNSKPILPQPVVLVDTHCQTSTLYLLQWHHEESIETLYIREVANRIQTMIRMNVKPEHIVISDGVVYMIGKKQLFVLGLDGGVERMEVLEDAEVVAMNAAWSQNGQAGVEIVYFNIKRGYFRRSYTREKKEESRKWRLSWFSNYPKYKYLQVIIPNILAIAFSANDSFVMYDLNCMSEIVNGKSLLTDWQLSDSPLIRHHFHRRQQTDPQYLIIGIGSHNNIQILTYELHLLDNVPPQVSIISTSARVVDWTRSHLRKQLVINTEGQHLADYTITFQGVVYMSYLSKYNYIPSANYVMFSQQYVDNPILTHQYTIWRDFNNDQTTLHTSMNRLFIPNRYCYQFVFKTLAIRPKDLMGLTNATLTKNQSRRMLFAWREKYCFEQFVVYQQELHIVRKQSLSVIHQITKEQFDGQNFPLQQKLAMDRVDSEMHCEASVSSLSNPESFELHHQLPNEMNRPIVLEEGYKYPPIQEYDQRNLGSKEKIQQVTKNELMSQKYSSIIREIECIITSNEMVRVLSIGQQFREVATVNRLKDRINSLSYALNFYRPYSIDKYCKRLIQRQTVIVLLLDYFRSLLYEPIQYLAYFGKDLISLWVQHICFEFTCDMDRDICELLKRLWKGLIPINKMENLSEILQQNQNQNEDNEFVQFVLELNRKAEWEQLAQCELLKIVGTGLLNNYGESFKTYWDSNGWFQAVSELPVTVKTHRLIYSQYLLRESDILKRNKRVQKQYMVDEQTQKYQKKQNQIALRGRGIAQLQWTLLVNDGFYGRQADLVTIKKELQADTDDHVVKIIDRLLSEQSRVQQCNMGSGFEQMIEQMQARCQSFIDSKNQQSNYESLKKHHKDLLDKCKILRSSCEISAAMRFLQLEEIMLLAYCKKFNQKCQSFQKDIGERMNKKTFLYHLLLQIESSVVRYRRNYEVLYKPITGMDFLLNNNDCFKSNRQTMKTNDEKLMSSAFLQENIVLLGQLATRNWLELVMLTFKLPNSQSDQRLSDFMLYHVEDNIVYEMLKCVLNPLREDLLKELFRHYNAKRMGKIICSNVEMEKLFKEVPDEIVATLGLTMTKRIALKAEYQNEYI